VHLSFQKGGGAFVLSIAGDRITLCSTIPSAPGSRLDGVLAAGGALRVKVASCRRRQSPAPSFTIEGRLIDTSRDTRAAIAALCDAAQQPDELDRG
jgi:hypothetical protein